MNDQNWESHLTFIPCLQELEAAGYGRAHGTAWEPASAQWQEERARRALAYRRAEQNMRRRRLGFRTFLKVVEQDRRRAAWNELVRGLAA